MTDLLYSDVEEDLRSSVRSLLADRSPGSQVLKRAETSDTYDVELWRALAADMGLAGLLIPESLGGAGASAREAAVVLEELGRAVAPVPFLGSAVVATTALLHCVDSNGGDGLFRMCFSEASKRNRQPRTSNSPCGPKRKS